MKQIRRGKSIIEAQLEAGYESPSGFRDAFLKIPYGATRSYAAQALSMGVPRATRAVANANGANQLAIVIPCYRIINSNGALGGYGGGIARKEWLLIHEKKHIWSHSCPK